MTSSRATGSGTLRLFVAKDEHKFSCAHMTIFADGTKERLHGHNYHASAAVEISPEQPGVMLDFAIVKQALSTLCAELREHLLIPARHPSVRVVQEQHGELELLVCGRRYVVPADEVLLLPVGNLVVEELAEYLWHRVEDALRSELLATGVVSLEVTVTESPGQGATWRASVGAAPGTEPEARS